MEDICTASRQAVRTGIADAQSLLQGSSRSRVKGEGLEYVDFRPYVPGDDIRYVDWRISARRTVPGNRIDLVVKEFMSEKMVHTLIVLDMSSSMVFKDKLPGSLYTSSLMISLAEAFEDKIMIGIISGDEYRVYVPRRPREAIYYLVNRVCREKPCSGEKDTATLFGEIIRKTRMIRGAVFLTDYSHTPEHIRVLRKISVARGLSLSLIYFYDWAEINPPLEKGYVPICDLNGECIAGDIRAIYKAIREHVHRINAVSKLVTPYVIRIMGLTGARTEKLRIMNTYLSIRTRKPLVPTR